MINGVAGTYKLDVSDDGKSGRSDTFALKLSTGYKASGTLGGGNIQLHKDHCNKGPKDHKDHKDHDGKDHCDDEDDGDQNRSEQMSPFSKSGKK